MFKKSIPLMLGALLLGTTVKAVDIPCPQSIPEPNKISDGTFSWYIIASTEPTALTFDNASKVSIEAGKSTIQCTYKDEHGDQYLLKTWTPQKCSIAASANVEEKGKKAGVGEPPLLSCTDSPSCANIKCGPF